LSLICQGWGEWRLFLFLHLFHMSIGIQKIGFVAGIAQTIAFRGACHCHVSFRALYPRPVARSLRYGRSILAPSGRLCCRRRFLPLTREFFPTSHRRRSCDNSQQHLINLAECTSLCARFLCFEMRCVTFFTTATSCGVLS